jgi:uncharacterized protein
MLFFPAYCLAGGYPADNDRYVNDNAGVLPPEDAASIRTLFADFEREMGARVVLLTIGSISDYDTSDTSIEAFATHLFNTWGIGDRQKNNGVLIVFAKSDRQVRIEVGSGYGQSLDAPMQRVITEFMLPEFKRGQYSSGVVAGARAVIDTLSGRAPVAQAESSGWSGWFLALIGGGLLAASGGTLIRRNYVRERTCPQCSQRSVEIAQATVVAASYSASGTGVKTRHCPSCGYHDERTYTIAQLYVSSSSSDSGGGGGGGSSDGGSSSGGGASGSW